MKINLTPTGPGAAWEVDFTHGVAPFDEESPRWGGQEAHSIEFDGVVRTVKDFRTHIRSLKKAAEVRHDEMLRLAAENNQLKEEHAQEIALAKDKIKDLETHVMFLRNRVTELEEELNPSGDPEFLGDIDHDSPEGKDIRLRNQRREIIRQRRVIEDLTHQRFVAQESLKQKTEDTHRLQVRNRDLETRLLEAHEEGKMLKTALEDYRNHGRLYRLGAEPQPLQSPTSGMTVFGVDYEVAYERIRSYEELERKKKIADYKAELASHRDEERKKEITGLQEALRQKNEIIKDIREKVAEARIYE